MDFLGELTRAKSLLDRGDSAGSMKILRGLEEEFREGARVWDVLGDVLVQSGDIRLGTHYKTLFSILGKIFEVSDNSEYEDSASMSREGQVWPIFTKGPLVSEHVGSSWSADRVSAGIHGVEASPDDFVPATPAMGKQFMNQGHFDLALRIFEKILQADPGNHDVIHLKEEAERLGKRKKVLDVMEEWLGNIERIRSSRRNPL